MSDYTVISDGDVDADSPVDEDLMTDLKENVEHVYERAPLTTDESNIALAHGTVTATGAIDGGGDADFTKAIVFSTDSDGGDPGFSSTPRIAIGWGEDTANAEWGTNAGLMVSVWIEEATKSATGFTVRCKFHDSPSTSQTVGVLIDFIAIGPR
jgi:hypothetical protein